MKKLSTKFSASDSVMTHYDFFESRFGQVMATTSRWPSQSEALSGFYFLGQKYEPTVQEDWVRSNTPLIRELKSQWAHYEKNGRFVFDLPFDLKGTDFQKRVWQALLAIPAGATSTYGSIAQRVGSKAAVRAAGSAIGHNPISVLVPCHRIVGSTGALTGYAGGLARKLALLTHEGVATVGAADNARTTQQSNLFS